MIKIWFYKSGEKNDDSNNYYVQCLKFINKGFDNGKNKFVDDKTVQRLANLGVVNFQERLLFSEIAIILSNKDVKLNIDDIEEIKDLMKLSNIAQFYGDINAEQKVKAKITNIVMDDLRYKTSLKNAIVKGFDEKLLPEK